jgi:ABC-type glycerol-3-phosphate transport system substrate-binding protein
MRTVSRRSLLRRSVALTATGALMKPYMVNATATTATVWWTQGFAQEEDIAFKKIVADYEKASGNTIDYNIMPYGCRARRLARLL